MLRSKKPGLVLVEASAAGTIGAGVDAAGAGATAASLSCFLLERSLLLCDLSTPRFEVRVLATLLVVPGLCLGLGLASRAFLALHIGVDTVATRAQHAPTRVNTPTRPPLRERRLPHFIGQGTLTIVSAGWSRWVVPAASEDRLLRASMATTVEPRHMSLASLIHLNALERMSAPLAL